MLYLLHLRRWYCCREVPVQSTKLRIGRWEFRSNECVSTTIRSSAPTTASKTTVLISQLLFKKKLRVITVSTRVGLNSINSSSIPSRHLTQCLKIASQAGVWGGRVIGPLPLFFNYFANYMNL